MTGSQGEGEPVRPERGEVLWTPDPARLATSRLAAFQAWVGARLDRELRDYGELWAWSVEDPGGFWRAVWDYFGVIGRRGSEVVVGGLPTARWFPGATLNYAENAMARLPAEAVVGLSQTRSTLRLSGEALGEMVGRVRSGLLDLGVDPGDRVAAYLPNGPEALAAFLATASIGAVWSSCAPEFGPTAVLDRLGQIRPKVLLGIDAYRHGTRLIDRTEELAELRRGLPELDALVVLPYGGAGGPVPGATTWSELTARSGPVVFEPVAFDHPLFILYSSGTTGPPKPIVHGHGGILLEHLKALGLHADLGPGDRFFWFSTTGWMMWNFLVSGLLVGATVVCFDGDPGYPDLGALWGMAVDERLTYFGTSAPFVMACLRSGLRPGDGGGFPDLRTVGSTGSPLPAEGARWVYRAVKRDLLLSSLSGGTDVCTAFVGGTPTVPVRAGEISTRYLGARVEVFDPDGRSVTGVEGELVVTAPMPSMPVGLWGDPDRSRYRETYFSEFPGVWRHGDWATLFDDGFCVITGRSDATLNRSGVRIGTAEIYSVVEAVPGVRDSLIVHLEDEEGGGGTLILFVVPDGGGALDDMVRDEINRRLRRDLSPRHVPDSVLAVPAVPRTLSGKKLEVPVKRLLQGQPPDRVVTPGVLADPAALEPYLALARRLGGSGGGARRTGRTPETGRTPGSRP